MKCFVEAIWDQERERDACSFHVPVKFLILKLIVLMMSEMREKNIYIHRRRKK